MHRGTVGPHGGVRVLGGTPAALHGAPAGGGRPEQGGTHHGGWPKVPPHAAPHIRVQGLRVAALDYENRN